MTFREIESLALTAPRVMKHIGDGLMMGTEGIFRSGEGIWL